MRGVRTSTRWPRSRGSAFVAKSYHRMLMSVVGLYAAGFLMSRNSKNKNPTRTTIFRGSNTQLSVVCVSWVLKFISHRADSATKATWIAFETRGSRKFMRSIMPQCAKGQQGGKAAV